MTSTSTFVILTISFIAAHAAVTPRACDPGTKFCGNQLRDMGYTGTDQDSLYECGLNFEALFIIKCPYGFGCRVRGDYAHCAVYQGSKYCGYELRLLHNSGEVDDHKLYASNGTELEACAGRCQSGEFRRDSRCVADVSNACTAGEKYCGLQLTHRKFDTRAPHTLYECTNGTITASSMRAVAQCPSGCLSSTTSSQCSPKSAVQTPPGVISTTTTTTTTTRPPPTAPTTSWVNLFASGLNWNVAPRYYWAEKCYWTGGGVSTLHFKNTAKYDCSNKCLQTQGCTHFGWTSAYNNDCSVVIGSQMQLEAAARNTGPYAKTYDYVCGKIKP